MFDPEWLPALMQGSSSEIYVLDAASLRYMQVNHAACVNLQYAADELIGRTPCDFAPELDRGCLERAASSLRDGRAGEATLRTTHVRRDGSRYPIEIRLLHSPAARPPALLAIGTDTSARDAFAAALQSSESRLRAIAANTPGLVYQFLLRSDGSSTFPYVSLGCHALLGLDPDELHANAALFSELVLPEDRPSYFESMRASAAGLGSWNWEGRIRVRGWNDVKWINLRSTPRRIAGRDIVWDGIMANITQSKLAEAEIKQSRAQLAELSAHIQNVKEQERTRIAREIHDDLGGNLSAIKMALALLARRLPADDAGLAVKAAYVDALVDRTIEAIHRIAGDLRPGILDFGLIAAIEWQAGEFEKQSGIPCDILSDRQEIDLPADQATALFRIFQEALTNVAKHARATRVSVRLACGNGGLRLEIADNGCGIAAADRLKPKSFGIRGMMERARALGGHLSVSVASGGGSVISIEIPSPPSG
jgi:two-component system sensor histidine kinase UhpB